MELKTNRLILRDLKEADKKVLPSLVNDLDVSRYLAVVPFPYTQKDADWFVEHCKEEYKKKPRENYELGIELQETRELVGVIGLTDVNTWNNRATLGYWLAKNYWRRGYMYEALQGLLQYAFTKLNLNRIDISADIRNEASNNLIKKIGSTFEGVARKHTRIKSTGEVCDTNMYGLLKENWKQ